MAGENSKIILGLPNLPSDQIRPQELYPEFLTIYRAIQNLLNGVSRWSGIDQPDPVELSGMTGYEYMLESNLSSWYPQADEAISRGQIVRINAANRAARAIANNMTNLGVGVADEDAVFGQRFRVITNGLVDSISGMTAGTLYYLSPTVNGAIQNLAPITPGQVVQGLGWAIDANHFLFRPSSQPRQL